MFWWLSFADDSGFLGAAIVEGDDMKAAVTNAWKHGVNPGGEVKGMPLERAQSEEDLRPFVKHKLYSKADINAIDQAEKF